MQRPPLREIARHAGVSEPTVSRVLNGRDGVADATRARVITALRDLGVEIDEVPRPPRRGVIGVLCGDFLNPVFGTFVQHIAVAAARAEFVTTVAVMGPAPAVEERCIAELSSADALVFVGGSHAEHDGDLERYEALVSGGTPVVLVNGRPTGLPVTHVACDEQEAARQAVQLLLRLGHTRVGCILSSPRFMPTQHFERGYRIAMAEAGMPTPPNSIVDVPFTIEGGRAGANRLLQRQFTGAICANDLMAIGAMAAARTLRAVDEFSVVGYDGTDITAATDPPLTTLRQPFEDMSQLIVDAVVATLDGSDKYRDRFVFEADLLVRDSTRALRAPVLGESQASSA